MNIAFYDHPFHIKTRSSQFFIEILQTLDKVDVLYSFFDSNNDVIKEGYDLYVFWQIIPSLDILSSVDPKRVIIIPMYDACSTWNHFTWYKYRKFRFISFSTTIHKILLDLRIDSLLVRYVPPVRKNITLDLTKLSAFIWRRTNNMNIQKLLNSLESMGVNRVLIHDSPDSTTCSKINKNILSMNKMEINYTDGWFDTHEDYLNALSKCNIFIAPRKLEGIGMGFLEAMGLGLCVLSPNSPTMSEYIVDGDNGVLFDKFSNLSNKTINIRLLSKRSLETYEYYAQRWDLEKMSILSFCTKTPKDSSEGYNHPIRYSACDLKLFVGRTMDYLKTRLFKSDY